MKKETKAAVERGRRNVHNKTIDLISNLAPSLFKAKNSPKKKSLNDGLRAISAYMSTIQAPFFKHATLGKKDDPQVYSLLAEQNLIICNGSLYCLYASPACCAILGYDCLDLFGSQITDLLPKNEVDDFRDQFNSLKASIIDEKKERKSFRINCRMKGAGGSLPVYREVCFSGVIILNERDRAQAPRKVFVSRGGNGHMTVTAQKATGDSQYLINYDSVIQVVAGIELVIFDPRKVYTFYENSSYLLVTEHSSKILHASHTIVLNIGYFPDEVKDQFADSFIHPDDRAFSLEARKRSICSGFGVVVNRLLVNGKVIYCECVGRSETTEERDVFIIKARKLSEEEGRTRRDDDAKTYSSMISETPRSNFCSPIDLNSFDPDSLSSSVSQNILDTSSSIPGPSSTFQNSPILSPSFPPNIVNMSPMIQTFSQPRPMMLQYDVCPQPFPLTTQRPLQNQQLQPQELGSIPSISSASCTTGTLETTNFSPSSVENLQSVPISSQSFCLIYNSSTIPCVNSSQSFTNPIISFQNPILINASQIQFITQQVPTHEDQLSATSIPTSSSDFMKYPKHLSMDGSDPLPSTNEVSYRNLDQFIHKSNVPEDQTKY